MKKIQALFILLPGCTFCFGHAKKTELFELIKNWCWIAKVMNRWVIGLWANRQPFPFNSRMTA